MCKMKRFVSQKTNGNNVGDMRWADKYYAEKKTRNAEKHQATKKNIIIPNISQRNVIFKYLYLIFILIVCKFSKVASGFKVGPSLP